MSSRSDVTRPPLSEEQIEAVRRLVQQHLTGPIRVEHLASAVDMSPSCFARLFRSATGATPHQFILKERVHHAAALIRHGAGLTLAQIAVQCGFADQAHLTRVFRRVMGQTPAQFCRSGARDVA